MNEEDAMVLCEMDHWFIYLPPLLRSRPCG